MTWYANSEGRYGAKGAKGDLGEAIVEDYCKNNSILFEDKNDIVSQVKLKIDCLMQWLGSLKRKPKSVVKENVERFVPIKGFNKR